MRRSWLDRETTGNLNAAAAAAAYPESVRFRLAGLTVPEMVLSGRRAASLMLSSPMAAAEWQRKYGTRLAQRLVAAITGMENELAVEGLAVPAIAPVWPRLLLSCGAGTSRFWTSSMNPGLEGFTWMAKQCGLWHQNINCTSESDFLLFPEVVNKSSKLAVVSFPSYPSGTTMTRDAWWELCAAFEETGARLVNYNASASPQPAGSSFHEAASEFAHLSWLEIYDPCAMIGGSEGWSLVAIIGSDDFVADFKLAGRTDPLYLPMAAGVLAAFEEGAVETATVITERQAVLSDLCQVLSSAGLKLSVKPGAGYHALWLAPKTLDGEEVGNDARVFNEVMLNRYSVRGFAFGKTIAYSPLDMRGGDEWLTQLSEILAGSEIGY